MVAWVTEVSNASWIAIGTFALAIMTGFLAVEVHLTRRSEQAWRAEDSAAKGVEEFIGKYAEPGKLTVDRTGTVNLATGGPRLEVNRYGAVLLSELIGNFAGGFLSLSDGQYGAELIMELGVAKSKNPKKDRVAVGVLRRNGAGEMERRLRFIPGYELGPEIHPKFRAEWVLVCWRTNRLKNIQTVA